MGGRRQWQYPHRVFFFKSVGITIKKICKCYISLVKRITLMKICSLVTYFVLITFYIIWKKTDPSEIERTYTIRKQHIITRVY